MGEQPHFEMDQHYPVPAREARASEDQHYPVPAREARASEDLQAEMEEQHLKWDLLLQQVAEEPKLAAAREARASEYLQAISTGLTPPNNEGAAAISFTSAITTEWQRCRPPKQVAELPNSMPS